MIGFIKRHFARRRLRPVVSRLPRHLVKSFGADDYCTAGQARRAISDLRLPKSLEPHAYAAVCQHAEIEKAGMAMSPEHYRALRAELEDLFHLARADFTIADLLYVPHNPSDPPAENAYASGGTSHH
jgi:glutathione S-transferase